MTKQKKLILDRIKAGEFLLSLHARERMNERLVSDLDIIEVARTASGIRYQEEKGTYLISGLSTWGEKLMISAALYRQVIIVTVFFED